MKIELIESNGLFNGIKDISDRFGPSALILRNVKSNGQEFLFVAHESSATKHMLEDSKNIREDLSKNSQQTSQHEIEVIKDALEKLPRKINSSKKREHYVPRKTDDGDIYQGGFEDNTSIFKKNFQRLIDSAPISTHIRKLLNHAVESPKTQAELVSELESRVSFTVLS